MLNPAQKSDITQALLQCSLLQNAQYRDQILQDLAPAIANEVQRFPAARDDMRAVVDTCLNYPRGLEHLVDILRLRVDQPLALRKFHEALDYHVYRQFPWAEMAELRFLLGPEMVPDELAKRAFTHASARLQSLPHNWTEGQFFIHGIDALASSADSSAPERLLQYLCLCRGALRTDVAAELDDWMERNAESARVDLTALRRQTTTGPKSVSSTFEAVVLIKVTYTSASGEIQLDAWLFRDADQRTPRRLALPVGNEETCHNEAALPDLIKRIVNSCQRNYLNGSADLRVELLLPMSLLVSDADRREMRILDEPVRLGEHYRLAVRSFERLYGDESDDLLPQWRECWKQMPPAPTEEYLVAASTEADYSDLFYRRLKTPGRMLLGIVPPGDDRDSLTRMVRKLLVAGTSVALWTRKKQMDTEEVQTELRKVVCDPPREHLPRRVHDRRRGECPVWENVTLLWDDPNYCPGDLSYMTSVS